MPEIARRSMAELKPLDPALKADVREWAYELRTIWLAVGLSMGEFAVLHRPIDKGSVSRYLSGKRVPCDHWFLDKLLAIAARNGKPVTPEVREHLMGSQLRALEAAHPYEYKVRLVRDELEIAVTGKIEAERYARALEEQLAERNREIQGLTEDKNRLRATRDFEYERLTAEIEKLTRQLDVARRRTAEAERRCMELGSVLDLVDQAHPDQRQEADHLHSVDWDGIVLQLPLDDLNAVADFLSMLDRLDLRDQAGALSDRVVAHISDPHHFPSGMKHDDGLLRLFATMTEHGLDDQADKLSSQVGWSTGRRRRPHCPAAGGRYS
jgi:hypothetical protein